MKTWIHGSMVLLALGTLTMFGIGCDKCVVYCEGVADCYEEYMESWQAEGFQDREDFLDRCDDVRTIPGQIGQRTCELLIMDYECDDDSYMLW